MEKKKTEQKNKDEILNEDEILAEKIRLLWGFLADLIPHKAKLRKIVEKTRERSSMALSMAPILGAFGQDYEEVYLQREIERKRASALLNLIDVLDKTEKDRQRFKEGQIKKQKGLTEIHKVLGI